MATLDDAKEKQEKALRILKDENVTTSLQWLMDNEAEYPSAVILEQESDAEERARRKVHYKFTYNGNFYELFYENYGGFFLLTMGSGVCDFRLMVNNQTMLVTRCQRDYDEWSITTKIWWDTICLKQVKLSNWVYEIPDFVRSKQQKSEISDEEQRIIDEKEAQEIDDSIDLGDFA